MKFLTLTLISALICIGCNYNQKCKSGDIVFLNFEMFIKDSLKINESHHNHANNIDQHSIQKIVLGNNEIYPAWENDIIGKKENDSSIVFIPIKDVYSAKVVLDKGNIQFSDTIKIVYKIVQIETSNHNY